MSRTGKYRGLSQRERRLYNIWHSMLRRCEDPRRKDFRCYGGAGISVCDEWHDFERFVAWAKGAGYAPNLTLDRLNTKSGYSPENCRWVDMATQARNRRSCILINIDGMKKTAKDWAKASGISCFTIYSWIKRYGADRAAVKLKRALDMSCRAALYVAEKKGKV